MAIKRITPEYFTEIKTDLGWYRRRWTTDKRIAKKRGVSLKTVLQVKGSESFKDYQDMNKAQHPPMKNCLKDEIMACHKAEFDQKDNKYIPPSTAMLAVIQLRYKLENK